MPQSREECAQAIAEFSRQQAALEIIETDLDKKIAKLNELAEAKASVVRTKRDALSQVIQSFCEVNRSELTKGHRRKFFDFTTGRVQWNAGLVRAKVTDKAALLHTLTVHNLKHCFKVEQKPLLGEIKKLSPSVFKTLRGVTVMRNPEMFSIRPFEGKVDVQSEEQTERRMP